MECDLGTQFEENTETKQIKKKISITDSHIVQTPNIANGSDHFDINKRIMSEECNQFSALPKILSFSLLKICFERNKSGCEKKPQSHLFSK